MDVRRFLDPFPGRLVPIRTPVGPDTAFIPDALPGTWPFDPELWPLLVRAKEALGTLNGIGQTLSDPQLLLRPLQNREAITSSNIEGTFVTPEQLLLFDLNPTEPTSADDRKADWMEVANYGRSLQTGREMLRTLPICNRVVAEMHRVLMQGVRGRASFPGQFRRQQVQIGSNGRYVPAPPAEVDGLMRDLEAYINQDDAARDPLVRGFLVHYQFESIHPFTDGNGRVGRALLALMIQQWHGHAHPWLYLSSYFEKYKDEYMDNLFRVSTEGAWSRWVEFCLRGTIEQARDSIHRCHLFHALKAKFHGIAVDPSPRTHRMIEDLFANPVTTVSALAKKHDVAYATARKDVEKLISLRILAEMPDSYPRAIFCNAIMRIAFGDRPDETQE